MVETLEARRLLSSVTLITHGLQLDGQRPQWLEQMMLALDRHSPRQSGYLLTVNADLSTSLEPYWPNVRTTEYIPSDDIVVLLDWSAASGLLAARSTQEVAEAVLPRLLENLPGQSSKLIDRPLHLIGHSRGGALVGALAEDLGTRGIWVDHVSFLDPIPATFPFGDRRITLTQNTRYADNFFQTNDTFLDGVQVTGAVNLSLNPAGVNHSTAHSWYHGTIDPTATSDGEFAVRPDWYTTTNLGPRDRVGFAFARLGSRTPPSSALATPFGGTQPRTDNRDTTLPQWPNIADLTVSQRSSRNGGRLAASFLAQDFDSNAQVTFFLDPDRALGGDVRIGDATPLARAADPTRANADIRVSGLAPGSYFLRAEISDGTHRRYVYLDDPITITGEDPSQPSSLRATLRSTPTLLSPQARSGLIRLDIVNDGPGRFRGDIAVKFLASTDSSLDDSDTQIFSSTRPLSLAPASARTLSFRLPAPTDLGTADYRIFAVLETVGDLNPVPARVFALAASSTRIEAPFVNLSATVVSHPRSLRAGQLGTLTLRITNNGNTTAAGPFSLQTFLASPDSPDAQAQTGTLTRQLRIPPRSSILVRIPIIALGNPGQRTLSADIAYLGQPFTPPTSIFSNVPLQLFS
jgi:hypothetical protein